MIRRSAAALGAALAASFLFATPALAHGIGGRVDLPVPRWLFVFGAATVHYKILFVQALPAIAALTATARWRRRL